jgi:hypothetical protein
MRRKRVIGVAFTVILAICASACQSCPPSKSNKTTGSSSSSLRALHSSSSLIESVAR